MRGEHPATRVYHPQPARVAEKFVAVHVEPASLHQANRAKHGHPQQIPVPEAHPHSCGGSVEKV